MFYIYKKFYNTGLRVIYKKDNILFVEYVSGFVLPLESGKLIHMKYFYKNTIMDDFSSNETYYDKIDDSYIVFNLKESSDDMFILLKFDIENDTFIQYSNFDNMKSENLEIVCKFKIVNDNIYTLNDDIIAKNSYVYKSLMQLYNELKYEHFLTII